MKATKKLLKEADPFREELKEVLDRKDRAYKRMKRQKASGDLRHANLSRKAYEYCCDYAEKLKAIINGIETKANIKSVVFTKHSEKRYRYKSYLDGLKKWDESE